MAREGERRGATMRWFGPSWGAPVNDFGARVDVPASEPCAAGCGRPFIHSSQGIGIPDAGTGDYLWYHLEPCWMRLIGAEVSREVLGEDADSG